MGNGIQETYLKRKHKKIVWLEITTKIDMMIFCDWCQRTMPFYTSSEYLVYKDRIIDAIQCICVDCTPEMDDRKLCPEDDEYLNEDDDDGYPDDDDDALWDDEVYSDWSDNEFDDLLDDDLGWDDEDDLA
jgi:hypothetical protein